MAQRAFSVACVCIAAFAAWVAAASAELLALAPTSVTPASGTTLTPQGAVAFKLTSPSPRFGNFVVIVSAQPLLAPSGELGESIERINLNLVPGEAHVYAGASLFPANDASWSFTPGTYYWQAAAVYTETTPFLHATEEWSSPYRLTIAPVATSISTGAATQGPGASTTAPGATSQTPSAVTRTAALVHAKLEIKHRTGHTPIRLSISCAPPLGASIRCRASWLSGAPASAATLRYAGTFQFVSGTSAVRVSFTGTRERLTCARRHNARRCQAHVRW